MTLKLAVCHTPQVLKYNIIWNVYLFILFIAITISGQNSISNYNALILLLFLILFIYINRYYGEFYNTLLICGLICCTCLSGFSNILYVLIDCSTVAFILMAIDVGCKYKISYSESKYIYFSSFLIVALSILCSWNNNLYFNNDGDARYGGIFKAVNFSANIFAILEICIWELQKRFHIYKKETLLLYALLGLLVYYTDICGTRSLLFFYPYWGYQIYCKLKHNKYKKLIFSATIVALILLVPILINILVSKLRFQEGEASLATRANLYMVLMQGISDNYFFLPHGSNSSRIMIVDFTKDERYSPHNNFLSYLYDWGIIFIILLGIIYKRIKKNNLLNTNMILIYLGFSSYALHNMLFSIFLWIPFIVILMVNNGNKNSKYSSRCSTKI